MVELEWGFAFSFALCALTLTLSFSMITVRKNVQMAFCYSHYNDLGDRFGLDLEDA